MVAFLSDYISSLDEYNSNISNCNGDTNCESRVYHRMIIDANNRFDNFIITTTSQYNMPPLFLKVLLMQESNLVPAFSENNAGAVGIAQIVGRFAAQDMVDRGRAPQEVLNGIQYTDYLDGIRNNCNVAGYPTSEALCVDFAETERAVQEAAWYLNWQRSAIVRRFNPQCAFSQSICNAWELTPAEDQDALSWVMAAAAYNGGLGSILTALSSTAVTPGQPLTVSDFCSNLPTEETRRYIESITTGNIGAGPC